MKSTALWAAIIAVICLVGAVSYIALRNNAQSVSDKPLYKGVLGTPLKIRSPLIPAKNHPEFVVFQDDFMLKAFPALTEQKL